MANTYTQLYTQFVFATKNKQSLITSYNKERIEQYIYGIASNIKCKPLSIYCNPDHTHILVSSHPTICISNVVRDIKSFSGRFINANKLVQGHFEWQTGFGAFSYGRSQIDAVCKYIQNQLEHHKKVTFRDEYTALLKAFEIEYDEKYYLTGYCNVCLLRRPVWVVGHLIQWLRPTGYKTEHPLGANVGIRSNKTFNFLPI